MLFSLVMSREIGLLEILVAFRLDLSPHPDGMEVDRSLGSVASACSNPRSKQPCDLSVVVDVDSFGGRDFG